MIGKILTARMLMSPTKMGFGAKLSETVLLNFKIVASTLYLNFLEYLEGLTAKIKAPEEEPGADGISGHLLPQRQLRMLYQPQHYEYRTELFTLFDIFSRKLYLLIVNAKHD